MTIGGEPVVAGFLDSSTSSLVWTSSFTLNSGIAVWQPPELPDALTPELLEEISQDTELALAGAYLKALKGDASGLPALVDAWRRSPTDFTLIDALPKAMAAIGDDASVKYVKEIYASFDKDERQYRASALYTSIRRMDGPEAQALRKQMRVDLGPDLFR